MVATLHAHLEDNFSFKMISINVSSGKKQRENTKAIHGIKRGPIALRKLFYGAELLIVYWISLFAQKVNIVHFIWVGFDPLTQLMIKMAKARGSLVYVTVLSAFSPIKRYKGADCLIFHSDHSSRSFNNSKQALTSFQIIQPPVTFRTFPQSGQPYFVFLSGPRTKEQIEERGVYLLMDAMKALQQSGSKLRLKFIGRWPEGAQALEQLAKERELTNIELSHEFVQHVENVVGNSSGLLIPYVGEKIGDVPLSALEALACGTPVITTQEFHIHTANERPAITICEPSPSQLADTMKMVHKRGDVAQQCKSLVKNCSLDNFISAHEKLYYQPQKNIHD